MKNLNISGTQFYEYYLCKRKVFLLSRQLIANQENDFLILGRMIHENSYIRMRKEIVFDGCKIDLLSHKNGKLLVGEVKKSSKSLDANIRQLKYYLYRLKQRGEQLSGEIRIPKEKKLIHVELSESDEKEIQFTVSSIRKLISLENPPEAKWIKFCKSCAYAEFCWS
ncbi:MAG: CRISPR-associated protein Cas4 [Spirochaetota bacterium]|nr:CRISPR-associated protein Cas4 [Spirochaetota bacterium]